MKNKVSIVVLVLALVLSGCTTGANLKAGDPYQGGIVAHVDASGKSGLIVATIDLGSANWNDAMARCDGLVEGGYSDWYLPSKDELNKLYMGKTAIGGFDSYGWWSSTASGTSDAWVQDFNNGTQEVQYKFNIKRVRAVRKF